MKGRACVDGRQQHPLCKKEDSTSPAVGLELVLLTSVIDGMEKRDLAVADIPGAYLNSEMDDIV